MKRIICTIFAVLMLVAVLAGCKVKTSVNSNYVDSFVENYASPDQVDKDGNVTYTFENNEKYEQFLHDYYDEVKENSREEIKTEGQYSYYNPDVTEVVVGITPEAYEKATVEELKAEAEIVGQRALYYQMNTKDPKGELTVTYKNANTAEVYFTITVTAE